MRKKKKQRSEHRSHFVSHSGFFLGAGIASSWSASPACHCQRKSQSTSCLVFRFSSIELSKLHSISSKQKNQVFRLGFFSSVLGAGLEPARPNGHRILSPACLPIPPSEHPVLGIKKEHECSLFIGARNGIRTRDPDLGKVVLYQLSYSRNNHFNRAPSLRNGRQI